MHLIIGKSISMSGKKERTAVYFRRLKHPDALQFLVGDGYIIPGIEKGVIGMGGQGYNDKRFRKRMAKCRQ